MKTYTQFIYEIYNISEFVNTNVPQTTPKLAVPSGKFPAVKNIIGRAATPIYTALDVASEYQSQKQRGRSTPAALAMAATKAAGGLAGGALGSLLGSGIGAGIGGGLGAAVAGPPGAAVGSRLGGGLGGIAGGIAGYTKGSEYAGQGAETIAGATGKEKAQMAQMNRQRQTGGGLSGIGGQTTFSKGKSGTGFMSTGIGKQRRTVQLANTSVVKNPTTGKAETGYLAFKGGQAVYKRAQDPSTLARTSSNWLERVGRTISPGAYKAQDERVRQQRLRTASQNDIRRQKALGITGSRNLVGPKIVGPKIVGPKIVGPKVK